MDYKAYNSFNFHTIPQVKKLPDSLCTAVKAVSAVFPFKINNYIIEELIDWTNPLDDPIFQLTVPQPGMLAENELSSMILLIKNNAGKKEIAQAALEIQMKLNPHPAGQLNLNVPVEKGKIYRGMQHKYDETILYFPLPGQSCHAFCTYCFRWPQFMGIRDLKFGGNNPGDPVEYLQNHHEVKDILFTGGDPLIMNCNTLEKYIDPLLKAQPGNLKNIRLGSKVLSSWPYRFLTDKDSDDLLRLFERIVKQGFNLAFMAHITHPRELDTNAAKKAVKKINSTGAVIRCQAPVVHHINDRADIWQELWQKEAALGMVPYYMFIARDTGAQKYFRVSLVKALEIFTEAYRHVSGLARTVRGPSMSANPGKILIDGIIEVGGKKVFLLKVIQGRNSNWAGKIFFAEYSPDACWLDDLKSVESGKKFFYEEELKKMLEEKRLVLENKFR